MKTGLSDKDMWGPCLLTWFPRHIEIENKNTKQKSLVNTHYIKKEDEKKFKHLQISKYS